MSRLPVFLSSPGRPLSIVVMVSLSLLVGCSSNEQPLDFNPKDPAHGPGQAVGNGNPVSDGKFKGGADSVPKPRPVQPPDGTTVPDCGEKCLNYCEKRNFENPINRGLCPSLWGVGLQNKPLNRTQACRRVYADMIGRFPTRNEVRDCRNAPWEATVHELLASDRFVYVNKRRWADKLLYNNEAVSIERIYDADELVGKLYKGLVPYDHFAAIISAHPVLTRRYANAGDRAEAAFRLLMGRPPLGNERSDLARLYNLWGNGYYDHPELDMRLPDAFIEFDCLTEEGKVDPESKGECTSILWGYNELILEPDIRAKKEDDTWRMWSGQLSADEWEKLQLPGEILSRQRAFWEKAVDDVLQQYLGYNLGRKVPEVRDELVEYFLDNNGDIRSLHFAVATSVAYRQTTTGKANSPYRWTWGPLKQVQAEVWIDSIKKMTGYNLSKCDHRIPETEPLEDSDSLAALALLRNSRWELNDQGEVKDDYRDLARSLGGCPANEVGGRFKIISILTTAQQLNFVNELCAPSRQATGGVDVGQLLPSGVGEKKAVSGKVAKKIVQYQTQKFFGRNATKGEVKQAKKAGEKCSRSVCSAEEFARPACFALLSSSEMLFY